MENLEQYKKALTRLHSGLFAVMCEALGLTDEKDKEVLFYRMIAASEGDFFLDLHALGLDPDLESKIFGLALNIPQMQTEHPELCEYVKTVYEDVKKQQEL